MSLSSRVVIVRQSRLDHRALMMERPQMTRRASVPLPQTPQTPQTPQSSMPSQTTKSAPTTPKSAPTTSNSASTTPKSASTTPKLAQNTLKSIKSILKKSKSKPFTLVGRKRSTNSITNYFAPALNSSVTQPQPSTSGLSNVADEQTAAEPAEEADEFEDDILALKENDALYETDDED